MEEDWSQANDLAARNPKKLEEMKALFIDRIQEEQEPADWRRSVVDCAVPPGRCAGTDRSPNGPSMEPWLECRNPLRPSWER
jgi:hypothetical protein